MARLAGERMEASDGVMDQARPVIYQKLLQLVEDCMDKNMLSMANFHADKLVSMSGGNPFHVYTLARVLHLQGQHNKALHLLEKHNIFNRLKNHSDNSPGGQTLSALDLQFLWASCLAASKQWDECIHFVQDSLGSGSDHQRLVALARARFSEGKEEINPIALLLFLRGTAFEALENRQKAKDSYICALKCDARCSEAFFRLNDRHMLSQAEEESLFENLSFDGQDWLRSFYSTQIKQHCRVGDVARKFSPLEEHQLGNNSHVLATKAEQFYYKGDLQQAYDISKRVWDLDPYESKIGPVHIAILFALGKTNDLFYCAHNMALPAKYEEIKRMETSVPDRYSLVGYFVGIRVETMPELPCSWYAVACYYLLASQFEASRRFFRKATQMDPIFAPAWIGFGNAFAAECKNDKAMAAYRTALRLFPSSHFPPLYLGMENLRTNNLSLAGQFLDQAAQLRSDDPLIFNEIGVVCFRKTEYKRAADHFHKALDLSRNENEEIGVEWEPTIFNLASAYRKLKNYEKALEYYELCASLCHGKHCIFSALGLTYHLQGRLSKAIECYHKALGLKSDDNFAAEMLARALQEDVSTEILYTGRMGPPPASTPLRTPSASHSYRKEKSSRGVSIYCDQNGDEVAPDTSDLDMDISISDASMNMSRESPSSFLDTSADSHVSL